MRRYVEGRNAIANEPDGLGLPLLPVPVAVLRARTDVHVAFCAVPSS